VGEGDQNCLREDLSLPLGSVFFNRFQKIEEGDFRGRNVPAWVIEGMDVPTDKSVISAKHSGRFLYESVRALSCISVEKDVDESIVGQDDLDFYYRVVQNLNVVGGNEVRPVAGTLYSTGKFERAYMSH